MISDSNKKFNYVICLASDFSKCVSGASTLEEAVIKFNYWTEIMKLPVTIRKI